MNASKSKIGGVPAYSAPKYAKGSSNAAKASNHGQTQPAPKGGKK